MKTIIGVMAAIAILQGVVESSRSFDGRAAAWIPETTFEASFQGPATEIGTAALTERLSEICNRAGGATGVAVIHVETDRIVAIQGATQLPLYSVFKLPLAIAVLKEVEENRLELNKKVRVKPADVAAGWVANSHLWRKPVDRSIAELLALSIIHSDNTSSDKLLQLVGGPGAVTQRMRELGFQNIEIVSTVRKLSENRDRPNTGSAEDLARLLAQLQKGAVLQPAQLSLLLGFMQQAMTGAKRLRGNLPAGTPVGDKTGTGDKGAATNDVGIITLPKGRGHLAIAVLISGSKLPIEAQEKIIAEIGRAAYDAHAYSTSRTR
jgi:beta-lactamase class A